jgi:hypothetical protein
LKGFTSEPLRAQRKKKEHKPKPPLPGSPARLMFIKDTRDNFDNINYAVVKINLLSFYGCHLKGIRCHVLLSG